MNRILSSADFPMILMIVQYFLRSHVKIGYSRGILCSSFINFSFSFEKASSFPSPGLAGSVALCGTTVAAVVTGGAARRSWWLSLTIFGPGGTNRGEKGRASSERHAWPHRTGVPETKHTARTCSLGRSLALAYYSMLVHKIFTESQWVERAPSGKAKTKCSYWIAFSPDGTMQAVKPISYVYKPNVVVQILTFNDIFPKCAGNDCRQHPHSIL